VLKVLSKDGRLTNYARRSIAIERLQSGFDLRTNKFAQIIIFYLLKI